MESEKNIVNVRNRVGFVGLLQLIFIVLKLTGFIRWSWIWVLSPAWIYAAVAALLIVIYLVLAYLEWKEKNKRKRY